ncbi:MAG: biotin--[acetyl-CoA-carboxylase] ligase [Desulfofustis sp.]|jgi:BirA family biotin operon repressor/biotin-[acetyl-CoA-carboxylase] ligase
MSFTLSPDRLKTYIAQVELPERLQQWQQAPAETIFRYGSFVGSVIDQHESLERTMVHARNHIDHFEKIGRSVANGTVITARTLSASKGRFTRAWHAPPGGLWGCLIYISTLLPRYRLLVPLSLGIACCEAIRSSGAADAVIRWVNDVLINGCKVAGFLSENFSPHHSKEEYCLLGFGINLNNRAFPQALERTATSLAHQVGGKIDLERFSYCFLAKLSWNLGLLYWWEEQELHRSTEEDVQPHPLISRWKELTDSLGRRVVFGFDVMARPQYRARVRSIADDGGLILVLEDGTEVIEYSGEIRYLDEHHYFPG